MIEQRKISPSQLFVLMCLFEWGSAVVVGLGMQAKQDAWLAILLGMAGGWVLFCIYGSLYRYYPTLSLAEYIPRIVGTLVGYPLALLYILYFMYIASRVLRDIADLLLTSTLKDTPMLAISLLFISLTAYAVYLGAEVIARAAEIFFVVLIFFGIMVISFLFFSGAVKPENLSPILENGWKPVFQTAFPLTLTFPFGEMIVFSMLLPYLNEPKSGMRIGLSAMTFSGATLCLIVAMDIAVLGTHIATNAMFPLLKTVQKVNVGNFIQRLDPFVVATLMIGGFFKIALFFYGAFKGLTDLFQMKKHRCYLLLILGMIILFTSIKMESNITEHLKIGLKTVPYYLHLPFQVGIPLLLLIAAWIRKRTERV